jgi:hypothetical protein
MGSQNHYDSLELDEGEQTRMTQLLDELQARKDREEDAIAVLGEIDARIEKNAAEKAAAGKQATADFWSLWGEDGQEKFSDSLLPSLDEPVRKAFERAIWADLAVVHEKIIGARREQIFKLSPQGLSLHAKWQAEEEAKS